MTTTFPALIIVTGVDVKVDILILSFGEIQEANMVSKMEMFMLETNVTSYKRKCVNTG